MDHRHGLGLVDHPVQMMIITPDIADTEDPPRPAVDDGGHRVGSVGNSGTRGGALSLVGRRGFGGHFSFRCSKGGERR